MNFLDRFSNKARTSNFINSRPVGAEFFYAVGQTDMSKSLFAILRKRLKCINIPYSIFFANAENSEVCTLSQEIQRTVTWSLSLKLYFPVCFNNCLVTCHMFIEVSPHILCLLSVQSLSLKQI